MVFKKKQVRNAALEVDFKIYESKETLQSQK